MNLTWRNPPAHHWYAAKSPGLSLQCSSDGLGTLQKQSPAYSDADLWSGVVQAHGANLAEREKNRTRENKSHGWPVGVGVVSKYSLEKGPLESSKKVRNLWCRLSSSTSSPPLRGSPSLDEYGCHNPE
ncbi:hypothetical protein TNCV_2099071 [Trichonephila clavipes]|nr:hypothetical protein TNCV_2099071 [Trichonephila clavipes]